MHTNLFAKNRKLHNLQLPILNSKNSIIWDIHHRAMYIISIFSKIRLADQSKPCTEIYLQIIINCINLQLAIRISRNHSFQTCITQFSRSKPILRSIDQVDVLEPRSEVIPQTTDMYESLVETFKSDVIYNTRCTRGDARSFFLYLQNVFVHVCTKQNFLWIYSNIVLKIILNCMNLQIATQLIMMFNF